MLYFEIIIVIVKHLFKRLLESPLLLLWIIIGSIVSIIMGGYYVFFGTIVNILLLAMFVVIIKIMTDKSKEKIIPQIRHPRLELLSGILLLLFIFIELLILFKQVNIPYISPIISNFGLAIKENVYKLGGVGILKRNLDVMYEISTYFVFELIPMVILFLFWGYGFKRMGFVFCNLHLILVLLVIIVLLGLPNKVLFQQSCYTVLSAYVASIFGNAISEEIIFRGYLLPRLEAVLKNPINALVISAIFFNIIHVPSYLAQGMSIYKVILYCLSMSYPAGLLWGYLYLKTRSIIPGIILHASNGILGIVFISIAFK
jgi:membrane protease YdiL (CAAX protease family)